MHVIHEMMGRFKQESKAAGDYLTEFLAQPRRDILPTMLKEMKEMKVDAVETECYVVKHRGEQAAEEKKEQYPKEENGSG